MEEREDAAMTEEEIMSNLDLIQNIEGLIE